MIYHGVVTMCAIVHGSTYPSKWGHYVILKRHIRWPIAAMSCSRRMGPSATPLWETSDFKTRLFIRITVRTSYSVVRDGRAAGEVSGNGTFSYHLLSNRTVHSHPYHFTLFCYNSWKHRLLTLSCRTTYICIYMSYRTANLQMLHFIYLFNKYMYRIF